MHNNQNIQNILTKFQLDIIVRMIEFKPYKNYDIIDIIHALLDIKNFDYYEFAQKEFNIDLIKVIEDYDNLSEDDFSIKYIKTLKKLIKKTPKIIVNTFKVDKNEEYFIKLLNIDSKDIGNIEFFKILYSLKNNVFRNFCENFIKINSLNPSDLYNIISNCNPYIINHPILYSDSSSIKIIDTPVITHIFNTVYNTYEDFCEALVGDVYDTTSNLSITNFTRYYNDFDKASKILKVNSAGTHIFIVGQPGTGKTEFAKLLCSKNKLKAFDISINDIRQISSDFRQREVFLKDQLLGTSNNNVIIFDEAQDFFFNNQYMFNTISTFQYDKNTINKFLDNNKTPIIWISNSIEDIDPAYLRRFKYIIKMDENTDKEREVCINQKLKDIEVKSISDMIQVSNMYKLTYSSITTFIDNMIKIKGDSDDYVKMVNNYADIRGFVPVLNNLVSNYNIDLLNTDFNLKSLVNKIKESNAKDISILLYGVPGTGKSEFAKYLANQLGVEYLKKNASDIFGMYVGETEKNIKESFKEATNNNSLLIFDEADSFLQDRSKAFRSWEVTSVNEFLTQMENHKLPFIATTNLIDGLDKAAFRRFDFKIKYDYMRIEQVIKAFKIFFNLKVSEKDVRKLDMMTPGDFKVALKELRFEDDKITKDKVIEILLKEQSYKNSNKIGF